MVTDADLALVQRYTAGLAFEAMQQVRPERRPLWLRGLIGRLPTVGEVEALSYELARRFGEEARR